MWHIKKHKQWRQAKNEKEKKKKRKKKGKTKQIIYAFPYSMRNIHNNGFGCFVHIFFLSLKSHQNHSLKYV